MMNGKRYLYCLLFLLAGLIFYTGKLQAQEVPEHAKMKAPYTALWMNSYANFRLTDKLFWHGELHIRGTAHENTPFFGKMSKWYNRHGIKYLFSETFSGTWGGVFRGNFTPDPGNDNYHTMVPEYRIWHEYNFANPFPGFMAYHRIRIEHRWSRSNKKGAGFTFRNRWRYKFQIKYPLNKPSLSPGAFYINPDIELIMQSGKAVVDSPMEDLRLLGAVGYISSPRVKYATGLMYTMGQSLEAGYQYRNRWIWRFHMYVSLDMRKNKKK